MSTNIDRRGRKLVLALTSRSEGTPRQRRTKRVLVAAAGSAVALSMLAGIAVWQTRTVADTETAQTEVAPGAASAPAMRPAGAQTEDLVTVVYLVASPEQADMVNRGIAEVDFIRAQSGEPVLNWEVLLVASEADEVALQQLVELDAIRDQIGLPPFGLVDLRVPAAGLPPRDAVAISDAEAYQHWQQAQGAPISSIDPRP